MPPKRKLKPVYKVHLVRIERMVARHKSIIMHSVYDSELPKIIELIRRHGKPEKGTRGASTAKIITNLSRLDTVFAPLWRTAFYNMYEGAALEASEFIHETIVQCPSRETVVQCPPALQEIIDTYLRKNGSETINGILDEDIRWMADVLRNEAQAGKSINEIIGDITARFPGYSEGRAETIARTEIHRANGYALGEMMKTIAPGMHIVTESE